MREAHGGPREGGFTLVEAALAMVVLVPLLLGISVTSSTVNSTVDASNRAADALAQCRRMSQRIAKLVRPAQMSTIRVTAVAEDLTWLRATHVGEWIDPTDLVWRPGIEFTSASGLLSMNAALSTSPRRIEFLMDPEEIDNGQDDDGDGLVDEGSVELLQNSITLAILRDVEKCSFSLDERVLRMRLRVARRDSQRRLYRAEIQQEFFLRNN